MSLLFLSNFYFVVFIFLRLKFHSLLLPCCGKKFYGFVVNMLVVRRKIEKMMKKGDGDVG